jgi:hypothetical protein
MVASPRGQNRLNTISTTHTATHAMMIALVNTGPFDRH